MAMLSNKERAALDRYITGNYGEDMLRTSCKKCGGSFEPEEDEDICHRCSRAAALDDKQALLIAPKDGAPYMCGKCGKVHDGGRMYKAHIKKMVCYVVKKEV